METKLSDKERIALGECRSPYTTDRCPYCVDTCKAMISRVNVREQEIRLQYGKDAKVIWCNGCDKEVVSTNGIDCDKCVTS